MAARIFACALVAASLLVAPSAVQAAPPSCPTGIAAAMTKVNDFWIGGHPNPTDRTWVTGAYFTGDMSAATSLNKANYRSYALSWARTANFSLLGGASGTNADNQAAGQTFIELYQADPSHPANYIAQIDQSLRTMINRPAVNDWWWIDAFFMAMPSFAKLGVIRNDPAYAAKMYALFRDTKQNRGLWDAGKRLWWRDGGYVGRNVYWSRGNGWVIAALARVLDVLPANDPHRAEYVLTLQQMAAALRAAQQPSGFWYVNLGNPAQNPGPETSGTAFFTYGISWAINRGILDSATYAPVVTKAWQAMATTSVRPNGSLGYVQGPAADPNGSQPVTANSTAAYGVGAFLQAGGELLRLCGS